MEKIIVTYLRLCRACDIQDFIFYSIYQKIVVDFPAHTLYVLQPLEVGVVRPQEGL